MTDIYQLDCSGDILFKACYTLEPKEALTAFYNQMIKGDYNCWRYEEENKNIKTDALFPYISITELTGDVTTYIAYSKQYCE